MNFLPLLRKQLKSEELIDLLETHDVDVVYDYDRIYENIPDQYWASLRDIGIQLKFDENQKLSSIFIFLHEEDGFCPADLSGSDLLVFDTKADVKTYAAENGIGTSEGSGEFLGVPHDWIRFDFPDFAIHYDFGGGSLKKVSLNAT